MVDPHLESAAKERAQRDPKLIREAVNIRIETPWWLTAAMILSFAPLVVGIGLQILGRDFAILAIAAYGIEVKASFFYMLWTPVLLYMCGFTKLAKTVIRIMRKVAETETDLPDDWDSMDGQMLP